MKANIYIKYKDGILDPQGTTVCHALKTMKINHVESLTIGKFVEMYFGNISKKEAEAIADESCRKLLANPNIETYKFEIVDTK